MKRSLTELITRKIKRVAFNMIRSESKLVVPLGDYLSDDIILFGTWEEELTWTVRQFISENDKAALIDIGGNIGATPIMLKDYFEHFMVYEPIPGLYNIAKWNTRHIKNCTIHNMGVGNKPGKTNIYLASNTGSSSLIKSQSISTETIEIELVNGDHIKNQLDAIQSQINKIIIKIDVEGVDHIVFNEISWILNEDLKALVIIEVSDKKTESIILDELSKNCIARKISRRLNESISSRINVLFYGERFSLTPINFTEENRFPYEMVIEN